MVVNRSCDFLAGVNKNFFRFRINDVLGNLQADNVIGGIPVNLLTLDGEPIRVIESSQDSIIRSQILILEAESTKEDGPQEFALPIDTDIQDVLRRFVLELYL